MSTENFIRRWHELESKGNTCDYKRACLIQEARAALGDKFNVFMTQDLEQPPRRILTLTHMADATKVFANEHTWTLLGWYGIKQLLRLSPTNRTNMANTLVSLAHSTGGKPLSQTRIHETLVRYYPDIYAKPARGTRHAAANAQATRDLGTLVSEVKRLIAVKGYEFIANELSGDARRILGLKRRRQAAAV